MKRPLQTSKLWPVLLALGGLLTAALFLQRLAEDRSLQPLTIHIRAGSQGGANAASGEGELAGSALEEEIIDPRQQEARTLGRQGKVTKAISMMREVVKSHPADAAPLAELAFWLLQADQAKEALKAIRSARTLKPKVARYALREGVALSRLGKERASKAAYTEALALQPAMTQARLLLGGRLLRAGELEAARTVLTPATQAGSNAERAAAWVALGRIELGQNKAQQAAVAFEKGILLAPAMPELRMRIGKAWIAEGKDSAQRRRGLDVLERAALLAPDLPMIQNALGSGLEKMGDTSAARKAYSLSLGLDPANLFARRRLVRIAMNEEDFATARREVKALLDTDGSNPEHLFLAGLVAARAGDPVEATAAYRKAIERSKGRYPEAYFNLGRLARAAQQLPEAIQSYRTAIEQRPNYRAAWNNLGLALEAHGDSAEAEAALRKAVSLDPTHASSLVNLGSLLTDLGRYQEARPLLEQALTLRADYPAATQTLGIALLRSGESKQAVRLLQALVAKHPRNVKAHTGLGLALASSNDLAGAVAAYEAALAINAEHLPTLRQLAGALGELGRSSESIKRWEELLDFTPNDIEARLALAEQAIAAHNTEVCKRALSIARSQAEDDPRIQALQARCTP